MICERIKLLSQPGFLKIINYIANNLLNANHSGSNTVAICIPAYDAHVYERNV